MRQATTPRMNASPKTQNGPRVERDPLVVDPLVAVLPAEPRERARDGRSRALPACAVAMTSRKISAKPSVTIAR